MKQIRINRDEEIKNGSLIGKYQIGLEGNKFDST